MALSHSSQNDAGSASAQQNAKNEAFLDHVRSVIASVASATTKDGHLAAFGRQGVDEIGLALRAFPESIQAQEPGTIFDPTRGQPDADRSIYGESFVKGADRGEEQEMAAGKGDFIKDILSKLNRKSGGNSGEGNSKAGYERAREKSLADEQKEWQQRIEKERGDRTPDDRDRPGGRSR